MSVPVLAQEQEASSAVTDEPPRGEPAIPEEVTEDLTITPEELGVRDQSLLPGSPFYVVKEAWREVQHVFAFSAEGDARLDLKFASEKLIETQKLAEQSVDPAVLTEAIASFQQEIAEFEEEVAEVATTDQQGLEGLQEEAARIHFRQTAVLDELEEQVPESAVLAVDRAQEFATEAVARTLTEVGGGTAHLEEVLSKAAEGAGSSELSGLKALEVLKIVEGKVPEQAKEAIARARDNIQKHLEEGLRTIPAELRLQKMASYIRHMPGDEAKRLHVLDEMKFSANLPPELLSQIEVLKAKAAERFNEEFKKFESRDVREKFFEDLKHGSLSEVRVLDDLEAHVLDDDVRAEVERHHQDSVKKFRQAFQTDAQAQDIADRFEKLILEIRDNPDPKTFRLLEELRHELAPEQEEFVARLEEEGRLEMESRFTQEKDKFFQRINSINPRDMAYFEKFREEFAGSLPPEFQQNFDQVIEASRQSFEQRIKTFERAEDVEQFRSAFESQLSEEARETVLRQIPDFEQLVDPSKICGEQGGVWTGSYCSFNSLPRPTDSIFDPARACAEKGGVWTGSYCRFASELDSPLFDPVHACAEKGGTWTGTTCQFNESPSPIPPSSTFDPAKACQEKGGFWTGATCEFPQEAQPTEGDFQKVFGIFLEIFL